MSNANKKPKRDTNYLYILIAFVVGFVAGAGFAVYKITPQSDNATVEQKSAISDQQSQAITNLEAEVTTNPDRHEAWTRLGNLFFDTSQYNKAIQAYLKSLELHSGNANILTDLGIMYRRTQQPEKAIESFSKAIAIDPMHEFSRINKGIVQMYDLSDVQGAIETWENLLAINPNAKTGSGESVQSFVDHLKDELKAKTE